MRKTTKKLMLLGAIGCLSASSLASYAATLTLQVRSSANLGLSGATVKIKKAGTNAWTNLNGTNQLGNLVHDLGSNTGVYYVEVSYNNSVKTDTVEVQSNVTRTYNTIATTVNFKNSSNVPYTFHPMYVQKTGAAANTRIPLYTDYMGKASLEHFGTTPLTVGVTYNEGTFTRGLELYPGEIINISTKNVNIHWPHQLSYGGTNATNVSTNENDSVKSLELLPGSFNMKFASKQNKTNVAITTKAVVVPNGEESVVDFTVMQVRLKKSNGTHSGMSGGNYTITFADETSYSGVTTANGSNLLVLPGDLCDETVTVTASWGAEGYTTQEFSPLTVMVKDVQNLFDFTYQIASMNQNLGLLANNDVKVFPNPATDNIQVSFTGESRSLTIYNMLGQAVYTNNNYEANDVISVSNLASGNYSIMLQNGAEKQAVKFVKP